MNDQIPFVSLRNLCKVYPDQTDDLVVLDGVDLDIQAGEIVTVTGDSGSGKTTLLNLLAALDLPTQGQLRVGTWDLVGTREKDLARYRLETVGLVFQFHFLMRELSALENVALPQWMAGVERKTALSRSAELLDRVGLGPRSHAFPGQLSGGERQRVAIARALANRPPLLLADEPTGNLDEGHSRNIEDLLFDLVAQEGCTLVLVTHDLRLAARGHRHLRMRERRLEAL